MVKALDALGLDIASIHATQGKISDNAFLSWGRKTCELAEYLGAKVITVHPNRAKSGRDSLQKLVRRHLRTLQGKTSALITVETFEGADRVLTPDEIMATGLPMTLDTAHIHYDTKVLEIIRCYWKNIPVVHLSAKSPSEHHLPIDAFCIKVVRTLRDLGWSGSIVLEYLPWHRYRLRSDLRLLRRALNGKVKASEIRPPCDAYRGEPKMWHHNAPDLRTGM